MRNKALVSATYTETPPFVSRGRGVKGGVELGPVISAPSLAEMLQRFRRADKTVSPLSSCPPPQPPPAEAAANKTGETPSGASVLCLLLQRAPQKINASDN